MDENVALVKILSKPGVKRDGTLLDGDYYTDAKWCRWVIYRPWKIPGYRRLNNLIDGIPRGMHIYAVNNETFTHIGSASVLQQLTIDPNGVTSSVIDRTPAGFVSSVDNIWQFDSIYDSGGSATSILAHAAPNAADISSNVATDVYYGDITGGSALTATSFPAVSGGVAVSGPYTWAYGSDGIAYWSPPNDPSGYGSSGSGSARPCAQKIVKAMALRAGAGAGPTTLFWSLNTVERATFVGGTSVFNFDTISPTSSILSADSVIEYNGIYFWIGTDSFLMFNGVVRELVNEMNFDYFFDGINYAYRSRVFAMKIPKRGEIWWCYPRGSATECTHAIIYNVRYNTWYDTVLPNDGRSCAQYAQVFTSPLMCGVNMDSITLKYKVWQHEFGWDEVDGTQVNAIESYWETSEFGIPLSQGGDTGDGTVGSNVGAGNSKQGVTCERIEPDFNQSGDMTVTIYGRTNARTPQISAGPFTFPEYTATLTANEQAPGTRIADRFIRFRFTSNVRGGYYQTGTPIAHLVAGDARVTR